MIIVTGTKRSGTSMWMQVLKAAGFPVLGAEFLGNWAETIHAANPRGFFESGLRRGIYYATNPHPLRGTWLPPGPATARLTVKVFIPGVVRSDVSYLSRVVATMRPYREYVASLDRLNTMEGAALANAGKRQPPREVLPPLLEWWLENFMLVRDVATRRYPLHLVTYDRMLEDPRGALQPVLEWLGGGDLEAGVAAVSTAERTQHHAERDVGGEVAVRYGAVFDELYQTAHEQRPLEKGLIQRLNEVHLALLPELEAAVVKVVRSRVARRRARPDVLAPDLVETLVHGAGGHEGDEPTSDPDLGPTPPPGTDEGT